MLREKYDKALSLYQKILQDTPNEPSVLLRIGNIYETLGRNGDAVNTFFHVAQFYHNKEMYHQGIAVCRLILNIDPLHIPTQQRLEDMYLKLYGGLPHSRGDTIIPPTYVMNPDDESMVEVEDVNEFGSTITEKNRESWIPVDIVLSNLETGGSNSSSQYTHHRRSTPAEKIEEMFFPVIKNRVAVADIPKIPLFESLSTEEMQQIVRSEPVVHVDKNEFIIKEGERGDYFYIILKGSVHVLKGEWMKSIAWLGAGACFGEMALLGAGLRRSSVLAVEPTELLEIKSVELEMILNRFSGVAQKFHEYVHERLFENLMMSSELFCHFSTEEHYQLRSQFKQEVFLRRETIISRGDMVSHLYFIVEGRVEVLLDLPNKRRQLIRTMSIGESFGEIPLLTDAPSKVTFRAGDPLTTLCLPRAKFKDIIMHHPKILSLVSALLKSANTMTLSSL